MNNSNWYDRSKSPPIDMEHMREVLENPPISCGKECCPKDEHGNYCECITTVFPNIEHYETYLELLKRRIESAFVDLIQTKN